MVKRFLSANASEILAMNKEELKQSIKASAGRTICSEIIGNMQQSLATSPMRRWPCPMALICCC